MLVGGLTCKTDTAHRAAVAHRMHLLTHWRGGGREQAVNDGLRRDEPQESMSMDS